MSKLFILQLIFVTVLVVSVFAISVELYGPGPTDYDVVLNWAYAAGTGFAGGWICLILRLLLNLCRKRRK